MKRVFVFGILILFLIGFAFAASITSSAAEGPGASNYDAAKECVTDDDCELKDKPYCCGDETPEYTPDCFHVDEAPKEVNCTAPWGCPGIAAINTCTCVDNVCTGSYVKKDNTEKSEFCGTSTEGYCETKSDCKTGGCSNQVCENSTESTVTTCDALECYNYRKYNMKCGCVKNKCQWFESEGIKNITRDRNRITARVQTGTCPINCTCTGSVTTCQIRGGREMTVRAGASGNTIVQVKGVNVSTSVTLYKANETIYGVFRNETRAVRILPDEIKDRIRQRIRTKLENQTIELDEDGIYQVRAHKRARLFYLFPIREKIRTQINSETGEVIRTRNPWWGFLAKDVEEEIQE